MVTIIEIRETFREMSQEHEAKQEEMFTKHEKLILDIRTSQHDLTPRIYALHKITIALKFISYINQK